jgi:D-alanyl-D-alanine carboxypeptidase/D-alanyl-D-alanine-endopeptidase (penicillin-binding protein 4)
VLSALGPKHRFTTQVVRAPGSTELVLVGGGDPMLTSTDLATLARAAADAYSADPPVAGLRPTARPRVTVRIDDGLFPKPTRGPGWTGSYMPYSGAPVRPLARLGDYSWDTAANAAAVFADALRREGLRAKVAGRGGSPADGAVLARIRPHTVAEAVRHMLLVSENNVAEVLFRHVGLAESGDASWAGASAAVSSVLSGLGVDTSRLRISDGSGLSRSNRITPQALTEVLSLAVRADLPRLRTIYRDRGLPTAGQSGTLSTAYGRYSTKPSRCARGEVFAKTGSLFDTIALSGIAVGADGKPKAFSFLVNDRPTSVSMLSTRQALDGLAATVVGCW